MVCDLRHSYYERLLFSRECAKKTDHKESKFHDSGLQRPHSADCVAINTLEGMVTKALMQLQ